MFLSYRVADDEELVKSLYSKLQLDSKNHAIPLLEYSKFPHQFYKDLSNTADAAANVFLSARCLLDGEKWDWDSRSKGGFVGALMQSCVFVPVFSCCIDDCKPGHDPAKIGNIARMATLAQPAHDDIETWISMSEATQSHAAYLCFETASHSKRHVFLDGDVVEFDSYQNFDLPKFLCKNKKYFLVKANDCPRSHNKFQRFLVSELKGGPPLVLEACSGKFITKTFEFDWVDNVLLELLLAKEFHLHTKRAEHEDGISLRRCMTVLPVVLCDMAEFRWFINTFLSEKPSSCKSLQPPPSLSSRHTFVNLSSAATNLFTGTIAKAAAILKDLQMPTSEGFLQTSVKDAVNWYLDFQVCVRVKCNLRILCCDPFIIFSQCIITKNIVSGDIVGNRLFSSEGDRTSVMDHLLTVVAGKILDVVQRSVALGLMENFEGSNPQAHEMVGASCARHRA